MERLISTLSKHGHPTGTSTSLKTTTSHQRQSSNNQPITQHKTFNLQKSISTPHHAPPRNLRPEISLSALEQPFREPKPGIPQSGRSLLHDTRGPADLVDLAGVLYVRPGHEATLSTDKWCIPTRLGQVTWTYWTAKSSGAVSNFGFRLFMEVVSRGGFWVGVLNLKRNDYIMVCIELLEGWLFEITFYGNLR